MPAGGNLWRFKYRVDGKEKLLSLGKYPDVSLMKAREAVQQAKQMLAQGTDPSAVKQQTKQEKQDRLANTFAHLACEWHEKNRYRWKPNYAVCVLRYFEKEI